jgi:hypothetical protein
LNRKIACSPVTTVQKLDQLLPWTSAEQTGVPLRGLITASIAVSR